MSSAVVVLGVVMVAVVAAEVGLRALVRALRRDFQWLITEADERPHLDPAALDRFVASSFDEELGWVRRPNSTGRERGRHGEIVFHIDAAGARQSSWSGPPTVAAFGDSYVFCRQVEDGETWEEALAHSLQSGVMNFGVGNYGADQGLLRYERTALPDSVQVVVLGFVPETICRILSYWKHYLEFGNTFAFKPRFALAPSGELTLWPTAMRSRADFDALDARLREIQARDAFYARKFRALQFRPPYLASLLRQPARHTQLIRALLARRRARARGVASTTIESTPFALVMQRNIAEAHALYGDRDATALLRALLRRFVQEAERRGHQPLVLVIPQLIDLRARARARYESFFRTLAADLPILDVTPALDVPDADALYVEDQYGGHLSARGNAVVATRIAAWLATHRDAAPVPAPLRPL